VKLLAFSLDCGANVRARVGPPQSRIIPSSSNHCQLQEQAQKQRTEIFCESRLAVSRRCAKRGYFLLIVVNIQTLLPSLVGQFSTGVTAHFHPVDPAARQNGLVGRYFPSRVITAREPPSGSSTFLISSLKLIALMMPSPNFS